MERSHIQKAIDIHTRIIGTRPLGFYQGRNSPGRAAALAKFLDYVQTQAQVWICRRIDIARHWHQHHSPE